MANLLSFLLVSAEFIRPHNELLNDKLILGRIGVVVKFFISSMTKYLGLGLPLCQAISLERAAQEDILFSGCRMGRQDSLKE
jgi:hypothetical protein